MIANGILDYPRFKWFLPSKIAGAPHPDLYGGLMVLAPFLRNQGVNDIITLSDKPLEPNPEQFGFGYYFVETPDFRPPPDLERIVTFIDTRVGKARSVLVHCQGGIGRTGTVLAACLLRQDRTLSATQAVTYVREQYIPEHAYHRFPEDPSQFEALEQYARAR
jgi:atypical dual specificity phosphatase